MGGRILDQSVGPAEVISAPKANAQTAGIDQPSFQPEGPCLRRLQIDRWHRLPAESYKLHFESHVLSAGTRGMAYAPFLARERPNPLRKNVGWSLEVGSACCPPLSRRSQMVVLAL